MVNIATLIITNNTKYLEECVNSSVNPFVVFDGIDPIDAGNTYMVCNASRPSIARNLGLAQIKDVDFIQLLDSDDYLSPVYYDFINSILESNESFDLFYTDYSIINEDFNFTNREYLSSLDDAVVNCVFKIKNPIIRASALKNKKFNNDLLCHELVDMIYQIDFSNCYHIPYDLQFVRMHLKSHNRTISRSESDRSIKIISGQ